MSKHNVEEASAAGESLTLGASEIADENTGDPAAQEPGTEGVQAPAGAGQRSDADLPKALAEAERQRDEHLESLLRLRAEMDNLRKRVERDLENAHRYALERFVQELLPVKDSLEMGIAAAGEEGADVASLREGGELTLKMLEAATAKFGVTEVNPQGDAFDPERHQAMSTVDSPQAAPGTVVNVVQKGYLLNDRLVRPALVMVAK